MTQVRNLVVVVFVRDLFVMIGVFIDSKNGYCGENVTCDLSIEVDCSYAVVLKGESCS